MTLLAYGTLFFWCVVAAPLLFCLYLVESETFGAVLVLVGLAAGLHFLSDVPVLSWALTHWQDIAMAVPGYLVLGVAWAVIKWWLIFVPGQARRYTVERDRLLADYKRKNASDGTWLNFLRGRGYDFPPHPDRNKSRIMRWMGYWPFSLVATVIRHPILRFYHYVYDAMVSFYTRTSHRIFASRFEEFKEEPK